MCSVIGVIAKAKLKIGEALCNRLKYLEYRGYDSSGISYLKNTNIKRLRAKGELSELKKKINNDLSNVGIGHTRWATHGSPSEENAHPHGNEEVMIIHNGIIENYQELSNAIEIKLKTQTDSEVIFHYINYYLKKNIPILEIFKKIHNDFIGTYAIIAMFNNGEVISTRYKSPLVFGLNKEEIWIASDGSAISDNVNQNLCYLNDYDILHVKNYKNFQLINKEGKSIPPKFAKFANIEKIHFDKSNYKHFMLKEIHEQEKVIENNFAYLRKFNHKIQKPKRLLILACGTSYYAGLVSKYWFENMCKIPCDVIVASEFRYNLFIENYDLCILISQSGETIDVLAALDIVKANKIQTLGILNVIQSSIGRVVDHIMPICAGNEIGVASTKAFSSQLCSLYFLAHYFSNDDFFKKENSIIASIKESLLLENMILNIAKKFVNISHAFFIGRNQMYPIALEGALKLKEISYINANAYLAGELKHGPLALVDDKTLTIALVTDDHVFEKTLSNAKESLARGSDILYIGPEYILNNVTDAYKITFKNNKSVFSSTIILQLFAYHIADLKGCSIDKPRNLAKSVTVE